MTPDQTNSSSSSSSSSRLRPDVRNREWLSQNKGAALLAKMGWKDGQAVGKRQRLSSHSAATVVSSEGLRAVKRQDSLGLGAASDAAAAARHDHDHVRHFSSVLAALQQEHGSSGDGKGSSKKKKKRRRSPATVVLPTNKTTHSGTRKAKFQTRTADEMKCIFAGTAGSSEETLSPTAEKKQKKKKKRKADEEAVLACTVQGGSKLQKDKKKNRS
jgi:hypothetical protein